VSNDEKLREENGVLGQQIAHLNHLISKLKSEIEEKSSKREQEESSNIQEIQYLKQQL
jgi:hypothetical protein